MFVTIATRYPQQLILIFHLDKTLEMYYNKMSFVSLSRTLIQIWLEWCQLQDSYALVDRVTFRVVMQ